MEAINRAIEGAAEFSDFMRKTKGGLDVEAGVAERLRNAEKRPGENRAMYRERMRQERRQRVRHE